MNSGKAFVTISDGKSFEQHEVTWQSGELGYSLMAHVILEDDGTISVVALNLPGIGSCGSTREEAFANFMEAAATAIESYHGLGQPIPWDRDWKNKIPRPEIRRFVVPRA